MPVAVCVQAEDRTRDNRTSGAIEANEARDRVWQALRSKEPDLRAIFAYLDAVKGDLAILNDRQRKIVAMTLAAVVGELCLPSGKDGVPKAFADHEAN